MQLEAIEKPLRYRLRDGREILISPGQPVDLPDEAAQKLLARAPDRVKVGTPVQTSIDWLSAWRELAEKTAGLLPDDPRLVPLLEGLGHCNGVFLAGDCSRFLQAKATVLQTMAGERRLSCE